MKTTTQHNDPWNQGVEKIEINKKSLFVRLFKGLFVLIGFLLKAAIALFVGLVKLWAMTPEPDHQEELAKEQDEDVLGSPFLGEYIDGERKLF